MYNYRRGENAMMTEKIKMLCVKRKISAAQLAKLLGSSPVNLYNKFKRDNFSEKELQAIANIANCKLDISFIFEDGTKI